MHNSSINSLKIPSDKKFGWLFSVIFLLGFGYFYLNHLTRWSVLSGFLTLVFGWVTIFKPSLLAPLNRAWFSLSLLLGRAVSPIVLSVIFFVMIVPVAVVTRLFGRDALRLKKRQLSTYWVDKEPIEPDSFKNQF